MWQVFPSVTGYIRDRRGSPSSCFVYFSLLVLKMLEEYEYLFPWQQNTGEYAVYISKRWCACIISSSVAWLSLQKNNWFTNKVPGLVWRHRVAAASPPPSFVLIKGGLKARYATLLHPHLFYFGKCFWEEHPTPMPYKLMQCFFRLMLVHRAFDKRQMTVWRICSG